MTNAVAQATNSLSPINGLDVVNAVNGFYSSAFNHTIWLLGALLTILGFAVPAIYYFLQKRQLALKEKALFDRLEKEVVNLGESLRQANINFLTEQKTAMEDRFEVLESKINTEAAMAGGRSFHLQGNAQKDKGLFESALESYMLALEYYCKAKRLNAAQRVMRLITKVVLPEMKAKQFSEENIQHLNRALESATNLKSDLLNTDIDELKKALADAKNRKP